MKKIVSLLLTAVLLATMLTVFAVPAMAEETKTADEYRKEAEEYANNGQYEDAANAYTKTGEWYEKENAFNMAGDAFYQAGTKYNDAGNYASSAYAYMKAGECYLKNGDFSDAGTCFSNAAQAAWEKAKNPTASTLSEGSLTVICSVACLAVGLVGGLLIGKKKTKPALADGANNTDEE